MVERARLEIECTFARTVGSTKSPGAILSNGGFAVDPKGEGQEARSNPTRRAQCTDIGLE